MPLSTGAPGTQSIASRFALSIASGHAEVREAQRLRYKVFIEIIGLDALTNADGIDEDVYDDFCDQLIVRDTLSHSVVGTYRFLSSDAARRCGSYYSETEFDLSRLDHLRERMAEAGRACIHPDFRAGPVLLLLWRGIARLLKQTDCQYLIGCGSVSLADGGSLASALHYHFSDVCLAPIEYRVLPHIPLQMHEQVNSEPRIPPLLKTYTRSGAWIGGAPALDVDFNTADFFHAAVGKSAERRVFKSVFSRGSGISIAG